MALVIFFVPEPAKGVAEMARVVRPGGLVAAYAWDMPGGGFPFHPAHRELRALGFTPPLPPRAEVSSTEALHALWDGAGLTAVETREIAVQRRFESFDAFWEVTRVATSLRAVIETMAPGQAFPEWRRSSIDYMRTSCVLWRRRRCARRSAAG